MPGNVVTRALYLLWCWMMLGSLLALGAIKNLFRRKP